MSEITFNTYVDEKGVMYAIMAHSTGNTYFSKYYESDTEDNKTDFINRIENEFPNDKIKELYEDSI